MKTKEISVEISYLKSLKQYENIRFTAGATAVLEDGDTSKSAYAKLWDVVGDQVGIQLKEFDDSMGVKKGIN